MVEVRCVVLVRCAVEVRGVVEIRGVGKVRGVIKVKVRGVARVSCIEGKVFRGYGKVR